MTTGGNVCRCSVTTEILSVAPNRARNKFDAGPEPGCAHDHEQNSSHDRAHEKAVDSADGDDAGNDYDERAGGSADLRFRAAEGGDEESGDDGAVDAGLRREAGGDGKRHGQRKCDEADRDSGDQVQQEFVAIAVAQAEDRLRKPIVTEESTHHFDIIALAQGIG